MTPHVELKALVERIRGGDEAALATLCQTYREVAVMVLARQVGGTRVGRAWSVSDAVQSGMIELLKHLDTLAVSVGDIPAYLRAMARNKLRDRLARQSAQKRSAVEVGGEAAERAFGDLAADDKTASEVVALAEQYEAVLRGLGDADRLLIESWLAGTEWAEVAAATGHASADAARKACGRLIDRLRREHGGPAE